MKKTISATMIGKLPLGSYDVYDRVQPRLVLRVRPTGRHSYLVRLGRAKWYTLGQATDFTPEKARTLAQAVLGDVAHGKDPIAEKRKGHGTTLEKFLDEKYEPWAIANMKHGQWQVDRIRRHFSLLFGKMPLKEIDGFAVEKWRTARRKGDKPVSAATTNRDIGALRACLSQAVQWGLLPEHPLRRVKRAKEDNAAVVRFLSKAEQARLRAALASRDDRRRSERDSANAFRRERSYPVLPDFGTYTDHLTPVVLLALNTGLRRGELLGVSWTDIDLTLAILTVRGSGAKSGRTRHVPLNAEGVAVLKAWGAKSGGLVFPGVDGKPMFSLKTGWLALVKAAKLQNVRFHDLRHTFASSLVQAGVDLNTVRELLGHSDFGLTLRYAHLAAENKAAAVAKLGAS